MEKIVRWSVVLLVTVIATEAMGQVLEPIVPVSVDEGQQGWVQVAYDPINDRYLTVWEDYRDMANTGCNIWGRLINGDGTPFSDSFPICAVPICQYWPHLDFDPTLERYLVVFEDYRNSWSGDIYGIFVSSTGAIIPVASSEADGSFPISNNPGGIYGPAVAFNFRENVYLVAWADMRNFPADVYGQLVGSDGTLLPPPDPASATDNFPICNADEEQWNPDVTYCSVTNEWLVVFAWGNMDQSVVYGQRVSHLGGLLKQDGSAGAGPFAISEPTNFWTDSVQPKAQFDNEYMSTVPKATQMMGPVSECLVAWRHMSTADSDLRAQRIAYYPDFIAVLLGWKAGPPVDGLFFAAPVDLTGMPDSLLQLSNFPVSDAPGCQRTHDIAYSQYDNEFGIGWGDIRSGNPVNQDFYFQRCAINQFLEMSLLNADRSSTVPPDVNIPVDVTTAFEGSWNIPGVAHGSKSNEFFAVYVYSEYPDVPDSSDLHGRRIAGTEIPSAVPAHADNGLPLTFNVSANFPNPFNPETTIQFELPVPEYVQITVYDLEGRLVRTLLQERRAAGRHSVRWNGMDALGLSAPSGLYIYHVRAGDYSRSRKMLLIK